MGDIAITDVDETLDPAGNASFGALVSDSPHVTDIFGDACTSIGNCMSYCSDVCLRTFSLKVSQFGTENCMGNLRLMVVWHCKEDERASKGKRSSSDNTNELYYKK